LSVAVAGELPGILKRKILTGEAARDEFGPGRDFRLVFTNGCFDILHRGHVQLLVQARELGDCLLVGLNSDGSTRRLKGSGRPLQSEIDRAACLAALECVDAVVVFDEDTPADLIAALQPDVMVKGGDYTAEQLPERDVVEAGGGKIVIVPYIEGLSTTELLEKIHRMNLP
jgi:D-beta-D-heptose 7-phosphate kinase/D-beta-D-heptose 1-phosphate adenosyltransferase